MRNSTIIMCPIMASRLAALLIWAAVAASLAYWGLRWLAPATGVPHNAAAVALESGSRGDLRRLLAGPAQATDTPGDPSLASALAGRLQTSDLSNKEKTCGHRLARSSAICECNQTVGIL